MPAVSKKQRQLMAIAEHKPEDVYAKNRGVLKMTKKQLKDYASTSEKNLPNKTRRKKSTRKPKSIMPKKRR